MAASCTVRNDVMLLYMCSIMSQVPRRSCRSNWVLFGIAFRLFAETWLTGVYSKTRENCLMRMVPSVQQMTVTTHPSTAERVSRLRQQAVEMGQSPRPWG